MKRVVQFAAAAASSGSETDEIAAAADEQSVDDDTDGGATGKSRKTSSPSHPRIAGFSNTTYGNLLKRRATIQIPGFSNAKYARLIDGTRYLYLGAAAPSNDDYWGKLTSSLLPLSAPIGAANKRDEYSLQLCANLSAAAAAAADNSSGGPPRFRLYCGSEREISLINSVDEWEGFPNRAGYSLSAICWSIRPPKNREQTRHFMRLVYEALGVARISLRDIKVRESLKTVCEVEWFATATTPDGSKPRWMQILESETTISILLPAYLDIGEHCKWRETTTVAATDYFTTGGGKGGGKLFEYDLGFTECYKATFRIQVNCSASAVVYTTNWPRPPISRYYNPEEEMQASSSSSSRRRSINSQTKITYELW